MSEGLTSDRALRDDSAVIAPSPTRRARAAVFQAYVLISSAVFVTLAVVAHTVAYFPIDLTITRAFQRYHGPFISQLMHGVSWLGFVPQTDVLVGLTVLSLFLAGLRWEAVCTLFGACAVVVGALVKVIVFRPRPTADLVEVFSQLNSPSFPSGHVIEFTGFCGFLVFLVYTLLKPSWVRTVLLVFLGLIIVLMGPSRIYLGQHWFSDVMGAYLLGSLWLALTIKLYRWGKPRFFKRQRVAPAAPVARAT